MDERIRNHIVAYNESKNYGVSDDDIRETILEAEIVWQGNREEHRWYDLYDYVVKIDGMLLMYRWGEPKGEDATMDDMSMPFDINTVREAETEQVTITTYVPVIQEADDANGN